MHNTNTTNVCEVFLTEIQLSERWLVSPRTLQQQRWRNTGCSYVKLGRSVRYMMKDVEHYEAIHTNNLGDAHETR